MLGKLQIEIQLGIRDALMSLNYAFRMAIILRLQSVIRRCYSVSAPTMCMSCACDCMQDPQRHRKGERGGALAVISSSTLGSNAPWRWSSFKSRHCLWEIVCVLETIPFWLFASIRSRVTLFPFECSQSSVWRWGSIAALIKLPTASRWNCHTHFGIIFGHDCNWRERKVHSHRGMASYSKQIPFLWFNSDRNERAGNEDCSPASPLK